MIALTFVYAYFENATMFELQQRNWNGYPDYIRAQLEVIVTDDCSKRHPAEKHTIEPQLEFSLYRIQKKVPWNWLEARNIGAHHAKADWLLLTDMDHLISEEAVCAIFKTFHKLNPTIVYQFRRVTAPDLTPYKFHNDSFLVAKELFWKCGGYDEDYAGQYGTSGMFRRRLFATASDHKMLKKINLVLYPRGYVKDASTSSLPRKEGRDPNAIERIRVWKKENSRSIQLFRQPYKKVL